MKGRKKKAKIPGFMRHIVADNVLGMMNARYAESRNKPGALAKDAGLSLSTVQRILGAMSGSSVDNLEAVASALDLSLYQLLIPALDVTNPQIVHGAVKNEERMYRQWKKGGDSGKFPALQARASEVAQRK